MKRNLFSQKNMELLTTKSMELARTIRRLNNEISELKKELASTTGEARQAYLLVIRDKVWKMTQLIGQFWHLALDVTANEERVLHLPIQ